MHDVLVESTPLDKGVLEYIKLEHEKRFGLQIIESELLAWFLIIGQDGFPVAGLSVASICDNSYPLLVEGISLEQLGGASEALELTNFFSFDSKYWVAQLVSLLRSALNYVREIGGRKLVFFASRPLCRIISKLGIKYKWLNNNCSELDVPNALNRLRLHFGNGLNYIEEEKYLRKNEPRGISFDIFDCPDSVFS